jgi:hypothetical protein
METILVVLEPKLLKATDLAAKRQKVNRSALIREASRQHLKRLRDLELEAQDRRGYEGGVCAVDRCKREGTSKLGTGPAAPTGPAAALLRIIEHDPALAVKAIHRV